MKYNIMDSEMEGKAKVNYNGQAPARTLKISFVPKHGEDLNLDFKMSGPNMSGWRFDFESTRSGTTLTKFQHEHEGRPQHGPNVCLLRILLLEGWKVLHPRNPRHQDHVQQEGQELHDGQDALRGQEYGGWTEVPGEEV